MEDIRKSVYNDFISTIKFISKQQVNKNTDFYNYVVVHECINCRLEILGAINKNLRCVLNTIF